MGGTEFELVFGALSIFLSGLSVCLSFPNFASVFELIKIISSLPFGNSFRTFGKLIPFFFASTSFI